MRRQRSDWQAAQRFRLRELPERSRRRREPGLKIDCRLWPAQPGRLRVDRLKFDRVRARQLQVEMVLFGRRGSLRLPVAGPHRLQVRSRLAAGQIVERAVGLRAARRQFLLLRAAGSRQCRLWRPGLGRAEPSPAWRRDVLPGRQCSIPIRIRLRRRQALRFHLELWGPVWPWLARWYEPAEPRRPNAHGELRWSGARGAARACVWRWRAYGSWGRRLSRLLASSDGQRAPGWSRAT